MQLSAFHQDRANRLPEQTQRRVHGGAARTRRHGIVKIFHWEGEPRHSYYVFTYIRSFEPRHLPPTPPLPPVRHTTIRHLHTYTARQPNEPYTPREVCDEPLIPHPTWQPGYTRAAFRLPLHLWLGMYTGDLGWGPRTRHLVFTTHPAVLLGWKLCCKQEDHRRIYTHRAFKWEQGQDNINFQYSQFKWKYGMSGR